MNEARIPFTKMSFSPDVPSTALGPNEYNAGYNVETDVRGIRSVSGDEAILATVPGTPSYITGGFRADGDFWFIVATGDGVTTSQWLASNGGAWIDITPPGFSSVYAQNTNITISWNGTIPFFNDALNPPMFWLDGASQMTMYSNVLPLAIDDIIYDTTTTLKLLFSTPQSTAPFVAGEYINITGVNNYFNGVYEVVTSDTTSVTYTATMSAGSPGAGGTVAPQYSWNYNPNWKSYTATFMRMYNSPNVGSILVAGGLTVIELQNIVGDSTTSSTTLLTTNATTSMIGAEIFGPDIPADTTIANVSPGVSITLSNASTGTNTGQTFQVVFSNTPVQYPVTVQWSQAFGLNQAPLTWEPTITNVANQLEVPLRGPCIDAFPSNGQMFLCSYWDTVVFSPINYATTSAPILGVRIYNMGRGLLTSNAWANTDKSVYGIDSRDVWMFDGNDFVGIGNQRVKNWLFDQLDPRYVDRLFMETNSQKNQIEIYYSTSDAYPSGVPNKMLAYRYDLDIWQAPRDVSKATFSVESPVWSYNGSAWVYDYGSRTVAYARGEANVSIVQKDHGTTWVDGDAITSQFRRDNVKMLPDYSGKMLVHRILPEVVNLDAKNVPIDPANPLQANLKGNISVAIGTADSVGQAPTFQSNVEMAIDTTSPWLQITQNEGRVNTIELFNSSNASIWMCSATTWQYSQVEDDR